MQTWQRPWGEMRGPGSCASAPASAIGSLGRAGLRLALALGLVLDIKGALLGRPGRELLCRASGLLARLSVIAVSDSFLGQRERHHSHIVAAAIGDGEEVPSVGT